MLGVDKIFIYDVQNVSEKIRKVLSYYEDSNFIKLIPWKLPIPSVRHQSYVGKEKKCTFLGCSENNPMYGVRNFAQWLHLLDCLYYNMNMCDYLGFWDHDEFFIPLNSITITDMMQGIDMKLNSNLGGVSAKSVRCKKNWLKDNATNMFTLTYNSKCYECVCYTVYIKSVVKARAILNMHMHQPYNMLKGYKYVHMKKYGALMYHYNYRGNMQAQDDKNIFSHYHTLVLEAQRKYAELQ